MKNNNIYCDTLSKTVTADIKGGSRIVNHSLRVLANNAAEDYATMPWTVFNGQGQRKYLTGQEVDLFVKTSKLRPIEVLTFCWMLAYSGCRISEALSLTRDSIDFESSHVIICCLKKRGKRIFRAIPLPPHYLKVLKQWLKSTEEDSEYLWPWSRMTGYRRIVEVMQEAGINGSYATPKGLRHAFGVRAIQASVPLTLVQKWLGHADIKTTAIYTNAMGPEEQEIAARMWQSKSASRGKMPASIDIFTDITGQESDFPAKSAKPTLTLHIPSINSDVENGKIAQKNADLQQKSQSSGLIPCRLLQFWILGRRLGRWLRLSKGGSHGDETRGNGCENPLSAAPCPSP